MNLRPLVVAVNQSNYSKADQIMTRVLMLTKYPNPHYMDAMQLKSGLKKMLDGYGNSGMVKTISSMTSKVVDDLSNQ